MQLPALTTPAGKAPAGTVPLPELKPTTTPAAKSLPEVTSATPKSAQPAPAAPYPVVVTGPGAKTTAPAPAPAPKSPEPPAAATTSSKPKVRLILTGTEAAPALPAAPAVGPPMPSHLPDLDLPAPAEGKPAAWANTKEDEGPILFPDEPAKPSGVELAVAKGPQVAGGAVPAYLPAEAKPDLPALAPVAAAPPKAPAAAAPRAPVRPLRLPDPPHEERLMFPRAETEAPRRSYTDVTAAPCFAHAKDYAWLCGRAEYSRLSKAWRLRYASVDEPDRYGGSVTLVPGPKLDALKDGEYVRVTGHLTADAAGLSPEYEVESLTPVQHPNAPSPAVNEADEF
jgi:hypothetical protein